jgi:hypothetical protein
MVRAQMSTGESPAANSASKPSTGTGKNWLSMRSVFSLALR